MAIAFVMAFYGFYAPPLVHSQIQPEVYVVDAIPEPRFSQEQFNQVHTFFTNLSKYQGFNGVVLIGQHQQVFYADSFGYANFASRDSLTLNSSFQVASVSKQFTAVAILQLYQDGKLRLDDSVQKFIPDFPYQGITIHQLLCHRSGLPNYHYFLSRTPLSGEALVNNNQVISYMIEQHPQAYHNPNRRFQYSNTGYMLLAEIVEKASGIPFEEYLKQQIFDPLEMTSTFVWHGAPEHDYPDKTTGYIYHWRKAEDNYLDGALGDKGVYSSVNDLFKWDQGLYSGKIINSDTLALAFRPVGKPLKSLSNYGYGWRMFNYGPDEMKILYHGGWWHGYRSLLVHIPADSTTIVVLKNRSSGARIGVRTLLKMLYPVNEPAEIQERADSLDIES